MRLPFIRRNSLSLPARHFHSTPTPGPGEASLVPANLPEPLAQRRSWRPFPARSRAQRRTPPAGPASSPQPSPRPHCSASNPRRVPRSVLGYAQGAARFPASEGLLGTPGLSHPWMHLHSDRPPLSFITQTIKNRDRKSQKHKKKLPVIPQGICLSAHTLVRLHSHERARRQRCSHAARIRNRRETASCQSAGA